MKQKILGFLAFLFIRLLKLTLRYEFMFSKEEDKLLFDQALKKQENILISFFHQDELCLLPYFTHKNFSVMVSHSKDGEIMATAIKLLGFIPVRGSSSRGAVSALIASIKKVKEGYNFALAVDGPRGPIFKVKEGIISIQNKTLKPIFPLRAQATNAYIFKKSWNKAKLPRPFSKIKVFVGPSSSEYATNTLEQILQSLPS